jgi:hypothetical protein
VRLVQLVRFLVVELTHSDSNLKFDMSVVFTANYSFGGRRRPVDSVTLLVIDFVNLKIKPVQSFRDVYRDRMCVFIDVTVLKKTVVALPPEAPVAFSFPPTTFPYLPSL